MRAICADVSPSIAGYDQKIRFWEASSGQPGRTIQYADSQVNRLELTPDKQFVAAAGNPHVRLFEVATANPSPVTSYDGHTSNVTAVGFQRDGKWLYTGSEDGTIKIWDLRAPGCQREYACSAPVNTVVLHPNQGELLSGDQNGNVRVWDLTANACSRELVPDGEVAVRSLAVTPDAQLVCGANNKGACFIWRLGDEDCSRFDPLQRLEAHRTYVLRALFSPDSKTLATCSADHTVKLWRQGPRKDKEAGEFRLERTLSGHQRWVWDAAFSTDSNYLVSASSDHIARLWDLASGDLIRQYTGHHKVVSAVCLAD